MTSTLVFLTLCSILVLANAQPGCNTPCETNPCDEDAICPRFLNADCRVDSCSCTPRFMFRRRDVTDRCGESCDTRECGPFRQCMEDMVSYPPGCTGQRRCRQRLRTRCVRVPRPMSCEDVDCGEGMMCQMRERRNRPPVVRCVPAPPTTEPPTTEPLATTQQTTTTTQTTTAFTTPPTTMFPFTTTSRPTTSSPTTPPVLCNGVGCSPGTECVEFPPEGISGFSGPQCFTTVRLDCDSLSCPSEQECVIQAIPSANISLAACVPVGIFAGFPSGTCENITCDSNDTDTGCVSFTGPNLESAICTPGLNQTIEIGQFLQQRLLDQTSTTAVPTTASSTPSSTTAFPFTSPQTTTGRATTSQTTTTSSPTTPPVLCNGVECVDGTECVEFPPEGISGFSGPQCFTTVRPNCDSLSCPADQDCLVQSIPSADISFTLCIPVGALESFTPSTCEDINCNGTDTGCILLAHPSFGTSATCIPGLSQTIELAQFLLDQTSTTAPPTTFSTTTSPITNIFTTLSTTRPTPTDSPLCTEDCSSMGLQCVPFPVQTGGGGEPIVIGICLPIIGISCDDITCPEGQECIVQTFVERDLNVAQCVTATNVTPPPIVTCSTGQCPAGTACVDLRMGETQLPATCIPLDCSSDSECDIRQSGSVCIAIPPEFNIGVSSACVQSSAAFEFGIQTCAETERECPDPLTCQEAFFGDILVGTICNPNPFLSSCSQVSCSDGEECVLTMASIGTQAACASNTTIAFFEQVLESLGLLNSSTTAAPTTTELITTLSTVAPTTESSCPFDCTTFGQVCDSSGSFPMCVQPTSCTNELIMFCDMTFQDCQVSDGAASCVPRASCEQHVCPDSRFECVEIPALLITGQNGTVAQCIPPVGRACEELSCEEFGSCLETVVRDITVAQCVDPQSIPQFPGTCETLVCSDGMVCVDLQIGGLPAMGTCLAAGCSDDPSICDFATTCNFLPPEFGLSVDSVCVPTAVNPQVGTETCAESGRICTGPREVCLEAVIDSTLVGTSCSPITSVQTSTCQNSICQEGEECVLISSEGSTTVQMCLTSSIADIVIQIFEAIFEE